MTDNVTADIDTQLAAKTKELLGWQDGFAGLRFDISLLNWRYTQQTAPCYFTIIGSEWILSVRNFLSHTQKHCLVFLPIFGSPPLSKLNLLFPDHIVGTHRCSEIFVSGCVKCTTKNNKDNTPCHLLPPLLLFPFSNKQWRKKKKKKGTDGLLMGFVGLLLIKPLATGFVCLYKASAPVRM